MSSQPVVVTSKGADREYSFIESLSLAPKESFTLVSRQELGLPVFPTPPTSTTKTVVPRNDTVSRRTAPTTNDIVSRRTGPPSNNTISRRTGPTSNEPAPKKTEPNSNSSEKTTKAKPASNMAPSTKIQTQCLERCHKTTTLGNRISVRILEYLTSAKQLPQGFEALAHDFLDTCQILFSIEAGLGEHNGSAQGSFPPAMITELDNKFRVTQADFQILDQMLGKLLEYELGAMGRMKRGWGKIFGDTDIKRMTLALAKTRDSLKMSALVFQWSLGNDKIEREMGIGYTGLAAALGKLDRVDQKPSNEKPTNEKPQGHNDHTSLQYQQQQHYQQPQQQELSPTSTIVVMDNQDDRNSFSAQQQQQQQHQQQPPLPPLPWSGRTSGPPEPSLASSRDTRGDQRILMGSDHRLYSGAAGPGFARTVNSTGSNHNSHGHNNERLYSETTNTFINFNRASPMDDAQSTSQAGTICTAESDSLLEDIAGMELGPSKVVRLKADPFAMPRWAPRGTAGSDVSNMKVALICAVRDRNHKLVEQLLDRGVPANTGPEIHALKEAILAHDEESVRLLLLYGADPNDPDRDGITPLYASVEKSFLAGATSLLKYGADTNLAAGMGLESPLAASVIANRVGFTHLLLIYNGDANLVTSDGNTLLISSINKKTPKKFIDLLLNYGADANAKNREGKTALFEAIQVGRADIVNTLLEHGANPNLPGPKHMLWPATYQSTCLQALLSHGADFKKCPGIMELATSINNIESVRILLKAGVNPNAKKDGVYTPLCTSIRDDRGELFQLLLSSGADPNTMASEYPAFKCITHNRVHFLPPLVAAGADLHSPKGILETAVSSNNMEALNWLLDQGLNPNDKSPSGMSPLTTAIREDRIEMVDSLLLRGADPNMRGEDWPVCMAVRKPHILKRILSVLAEPRAFKGVIEMAVHANQLESVKLLIAAGVSIEDKNGGVFSPLTTAIREDRKDIVTYLLSDGGADVNAPGEHLPIVKALRRYHGEDTEVLEQLLEHGADPNKVYRGWNAFMQAVENGDANILRLLSQRAGVDLDAKDDLGRTVGEMAASRGWEEAVSILLDGSVRL